MPFFTDQTGCHIQLHAPARRIVSLVPSITSTLHRLGLEEEVVGITRFCVHPSPWYREKKRIGGTKDVHIDQVLALQPDLILASKEENIREQVAALQLHVPVWTSDISQLPHCYQMIQALGQMTGRETAAGTLVADIQNGFAQLPPPTTVYKTVYLIWRNPYMAAGADTFIHQVMDIAGFRNVLANENRYPSLSVQQLQDLQPELVLLSSEPYPFKEEHIQELREWLPHTRIILVNGEPFSWYGDTLLQTPAYIQQIRDLLKSVTA